MKAAVVWFAAAAIVLTAGCSPEKAAGHRRSGDQVAGRATASKATVAQLRSVAEAACRCGRSAKGDTAECWKRFNADVAPYRESTPSGTACAPVSTQLRCFNEDDPGGGFCVVAKSQLVAGPAQLDLCTEAEVEIVETAYSEARDRTNDYDAAERIAEATARKLIAGEKLSRPKVRKGCGA